MGSKLSEAQRSQLRQLPGMSQLLADHTVAQLNERFGAQQTTDQLRTILDEMRHRIISPSPESGYQVELSLDSILELAAKNLEKRFNPTLHQVINATGVVIHTNLGRAPLSVAAQAAIDEIAGSYGTLEFNIESGKRGKRDNHIDQLVCEVTGSEDALVVNNTASAVMMILAAFCQGKEVIISRGQLIEIGGGFRVPDVMAQSGARLIEVGTTNRTHLRDYENAITENTAAIFIAHHSNFKIVGFTTEPPLEDICRVAHERGVPVIFDQGSGCMVDTTPFGLDKEPTVLEGIAAGCDLIAFSGDKLLGGPQAGIITGKSESVSQLKKHPLARALRPDKLCIAALAATLTHYLKDEVNEAVPVWQMISMPLDVIGNRANRWQEELASYGIEATVSDGFSTVGGGSLPGTTMPTKLVSLNHPNPEAFSARIRQNRPHVIGRIQDDKILLDPRTVWSEQEAAMLNSIKTNWNEAAQ